MNEVDTRVCGPLVTLTDGTLVEPPELVAELEGRPIVYSVFRALARRWPHTATYGEIYGISRWSTVDTPDMRACSMSAWRLRQMLEPYGVQVLNRPGTGYKLVVQDADTDVEGSGAVDSEAAGRPADSGDRASAGINA